MLVAGDTPDWEKIHNFIKNSSNLVIAQTISAHLWHKSAIYTSALYMLHYSLVCSVAPRKNFGALTTAPKFRRNDFADTSSATDRFFSVGASQMLPYANSWRKNKPYQTITNLTQPLQATHDGSIFYDTYQEITTFTGR